MRRWMRVKEMKKDVMEWREFNNVRSSNMPDGREVSLLECKVQIEDGWRKDVCGKNGRNREERLLSPLNTPEGREVMELDWSEWEREFIDERENEHHWKGDWWMGRREYWGCWDLRTVQMGGRQDGCCSIDDRIWNWSEKEMRGRCGIKWKKGCQMIKYSRWKGCEGIVVKIKKGRWWNCFKNNEMR